MVVKKCGLHTFLQLHQRIPSICYHEVVLWSLLEWNPDTPRKARAMYVEIHNILAERKMCLIYLSRPNLEVSIQN